MLPRGADAVMMVEHTDLVAADDHQRVEVKRAVTPGENVSYAGTDIARGETVLYAGQLITSREIGVLAAVGRSEVVVYRRPRVAIFSTGNEIVAPGAPLRLGAVYDSNAAIIGAAVEELGGTAVQLGVIPDEDDALASALARGCNRIWSCSPGGPPKARVISHTGWSAASATQVSSPTVSRSNPANRSASR